MLLKVISEHSVVTMFSVIIEDFELVNTLYVAFCIITPCILARRYKLSGAPVAEKDRENRSF